MLLKIDSINDLPEAADAILEALNGRSIVAFWGEMGAGKTTLIRALCDRLGVTDTVRGLRFWLRGVLLQWESVPDRVAGEDRRTAA